MAGYFIGLMSGTSLDGVDGVIAVVRRNRLHLVAAAHNVFPGALRSRLLALQISGPDEIHRAAVATIELCAVYARTAKCP